MIDYVEKPHDKTIAELYLTHRMPARLMCKELPLSQSFIEHRLAHMKKCGIIPKSSLPKTNSGGKGGAGRPTPPPPLYLQCMAHWRDLDREHPQGWGSLRIPSEHPKRMEGYVPLDMSLTGSSMDLIG